MEIKGQIEEIIYQNEANSYTIAVFSTEEQDVITVVGYLPFIAVGDSLKLQGKMVVHQEYGEQFKIETFEALLSRIAEVPENLTPLIVVLLAPIVNTPVIIASLFLVVLASTPKLGPIIDNPFVEIFKEYAPDIDIHISTQANIVSQHNANFWYNNGAKRVILGRELNKEQIKEVINKTPDDLETEIFVHGAICYAYSGRCY